MGAVVWEHWGALTSPWEPTHPVEESRRRAEPGQVLSPVSAKDLGPHDHLKLATGVKCFWQK